MPRFDYFVGQPPRPISSDHSQWAALLPLDRHAAASRSIEGKAVTYGDYFTAVSDYLSGQFIAVPGPQSAPLVLRESTRIEIHLIKHGAYYHPARLTVTSGDTCLTLAINVAISPIGRRQLPLEVESLLRLEHTLPANWVPRVYASGSGCAPGHSPFPMFIGQWFDDFHEVHRTPAAGQIQQWAVWDENRGPWRLDAGQVSDFYRKAVRILTGCFDPHTTGAILEWHHAAGDFIARKEGAELGVKLITVRRYAPMFPFTGEAPPDGALLIEQLAAFWMRTSLWMRIDRMDGVGELVWADDRTLSPMWEGFLHGLQFMVQHNGLPQEFPEIVCSIFGSYPPDYWLSMAEQIKDRCPSELPEAALFKQQGSCHAAGVANVVRSDRTHCQASPSGERPDAERV